MHKNYDKITITSPNTRMSNLVIFSEVSKSTLKCSLFKHEISAISYNMNEVRIYMYKEECPVLLRT